MGFERKIARADASRSASFPGISAGGSPSVGASKCAISRDGDASGDGSPGSAAPSPSSSLGSGGNTSPNTSRRFCTRRTYFCVVSKRMCPRYSMIAIALSPRIACQVAHVARVS